MDVRRRFTWRRLNAIAAAGSAVVWAIATYTDWVASTRFVSHVSMVTMISTFIAAWRADVPVRDKR